MSYLHIANLYKDQTILLLRECYALEKVHGTSAHVSLRLLPMQEASGGPSAAIQFFSGGESHERFKSLFDEERLRAAFLTLGQGSLTIYGEAYGGKQQGMRDVYGAELRFIVFDIKAGDVWLSVPEADQIAATFGLEFVPYARIATDLASIDAERDRPSEVAVRRGCGVQKREGVVLRPVVELTLSTGERVICKHKQDDFRERATPQKIVDSAKLAVLTAAEEIAREWVTPMRLAHVLDKLPGAGIEQMAAVIKAMVADVYREAAGEIVESREASAAIGKRTALLFKERLKNSLSG